MEDLPRSTFVINLAGAHDRWRAVDESHALYLRTEVELRRIEAVNAQDIDRLRVPGTISVSERACFMSHLRALDIAASEGPGPYWIAEDDVAFGPSTLPLIKSLLERLRGASWDIILTDVIVARAPDMLDLWMRRRALPPGSEPETFGLDRIAFGGTTSYLVHPRAVPRIRRLMRQSAAFNLPWDLWIRAMARRRQLACFTTLPFLTRASESPSQIRGEDMHMAWWGVFRDLMFCDTDAEAIAERLTRLDESEPLESLFGRVIAHVSNRAFTTPPLEAIHPRAASIARTSNADSRGSESNSASSA